MNCQRRLLGICEGHKGLKGCGQEGHRLIVQEICDKYAISSPSRHLKVTSASTASTTLKPARPANTCLTASTARVTSSATPPSIRATAWTVPEVTGADPPRWIRRLARRGTTRSRRRACASSARPGTIAIRITRQRRWCWRIRGVRPGCTARRRSGIWPTRWTAATRTTALKVSVLNTLEFRLQGTKNKNIFKGLKIKIIDSREGWKLNPLCSYPLTQINLVNHLVECLMTSRSLNDKVITNRTNS